MGERPKRLKKVQLRREIQLKEKIKHLKEAIRQGNEKEIDLCRNEIEHIQSLEKEAQDRKDRKYGLLYLQKPYANRCTLEGFVFDKSMNVDEIILQREKIAQLHKALLSLSNVDRTIVIEKYLYGASYRKLSMNLGLSDKTIKKHLELATKKLRVNLKNTPSFDF